MADRKESLYEVYAGERILDKIEKLDIEKLCRLTEEYKVRRIENRNGCFYIATIALERPNTSISTEQFLIHIADKFAVFREALARILGEVRTTTLTAPEIFEVITGFPKHTLLHEKFP